MKLFLTKEAKTFLEYVKKTKSILTHKTYKSILKEVLDIVKIKNNIVNMTSYRLHVGLLNEKTIVKKISALISFIEFLESEGCKFKIIEDGYIKNFKNSNFRKMLSSNFY